MDASSLVLSPPGNCSAHPAPEQGVPGKHRPLPVRQIAAWEWLACTLSSGPRTTACPLCRLSGGAFMHEPEKRERFPGRREHLSVPLWIRTFAPNCP